MTRFELGDFELAPDSLFSDVFWITVTPKTGRGGHGIFMERRAFPNVQFMDSHLFSN
jgi:hypothetical protein